VFAVACAETGDPSFAVKSSVSSSSLAAAAVTMDPNGFKTGGNDCIFYHVVRFFYFL
jgi:hypothetical protein